VRSLVAGALAGVAGFVASIVTLGDKFGIVPVLAIAAGAAVVVSTLGYIAHLNNLLSERTATQAQLTDAQESQAHVEHERDSLMSQVDALREQGGGLQIRITELDASTAELGRRYADMERERAKYEYTLEALANHHGRSVHHISAYIIHVIGDEAHADRIVERYVTSASSDGPILWYRTRIAVSGLRVPSLSSFRDLGADVEATQRLGDQSYKLTTLAAGHWTDGGIAALIVFDPEIGTEPREWSWGYRWPLWNPLREFHHDTIGFEVLRGVQYDLLEIRVVFPKGVQRPRLQAITRSAPPPFVVTDADQPTIAVRIIDPKPEHYAWTMTVEDV
jgi:hypothetical protein